MECNHGKMNETDKTFSNGTKHIELRCSNCNKFFRYKPQEMTRNRVMEMKFPFGKHEGRFLTEVLTEDFNYVSWFSEAPEIKEGAVKRACKFLLGIEK